jgi:hypothetical protein
MRWKHDQRNREFASMPDESIKTKQLILLRRCLVLHLLLFQQSEFLTQLPFQLPGIVLDNVQAAASCRPTNRKGGNNELPPWLERFSKRLDIIFPVIFEGEEMEQGAIMPQAVFSLRFEAGYIPFNPFNPRSLVSQPAAGLLQRNA